MSYLRDLIVGLVIVVLGALAVGWAAGVTAALAIGVGGMAVLGTAAFPLMQAAPGWDETGNRWWVHTQAANLSGESREKSARARQWWMGRAFGVGLAAIVVGIGVQILA